MRGVDLSEQEVTKKRYKYSHTKKIAKFINLEDENMLDWNQEEEKTKSYTT